MHRTGLTMCEVKGMFYLMVDQQVEEQSDCLSGHSRAVLALHIQMHKLCLGAQQMPMCDILDKNICALRYSIDFQVLLFHFFLF